MWITALALSLTLIAQGSAPSGQGEAQRVTFGMQCRFEDGSKVMLVATKQDARWMMFRETESGSKMVYADIGEGGQLTFEDETDPATVAAWHDAFADLKKQSLETVMAANITSFLKRKDVAPCGHKTFYWRGK